LLITALLKPVGFALQLADKEILPIWFGQGADPEILGVVIVWVHPQVQ
jgi:hypothetical protein